MPDNIGTNLDLALQAFHTAVGQTFTWGETSNIPCTRVPVPRTEVEDLIGNYGAGNAANADFWRICCSSASFNAGDGPFPREQDEFTWDDNGISPLMIWKVVDASAAPFDGVIGQITYLVYRRGADDSITADEDGNRKYIDLPESALTTP